MRIPVCIGILLTLGLISSVAAAEELADVDSPPNPFGDTKEQAVEAFRKATEFFADEEFAEAADAFRLAYSFKPKWKLLYNIGQCEVATKRYGVALEAFERYLAEGGDEVSPARQDEILTEVTRLRMMVGFVVVEAEAATEVLIDGLNRGTAPINREIPVSMGVPHEINAILHGELLQSTRVTVSGGKTIKLNFVKEKDPEPDPAIQEEEPNPVEMESDAEVEILETTREKKSNPLRTAGWATTASGAALIVATIITGSATLSRNKEIESNCPDGNCPPDMKATLESRDNLAIATNILGGVGLAAVAAGVTLLIIDKTKSEKAASLKPAIGPHYAGASLEWRF